MKYPQYPPQAFVNDMGALEKIVPLENWRDMPEWPLWAKGYNAAVQAANELTLAKYEMPIKEG